MLIKKEVAILKESLLETFENKQKKLQKEIDTLKKENSELSTHVENIKQEKDISNNQDKENNEIQLLLKSISETQELLRSSVTDKIKDIERTCGENVKNLDNNVRLGKDLEQSVNELWKILEKEENLHKWQQVVPAQSYATVLQQKKTSEDRNQLGENKSNNDRNQVEQIFKLVNFGDSIAKLIVPHQIIKCNEHEATNFSQSGAKVKDIYRQVERFKNIHKGSKVENIVMHVGTNQIQRESPRDSSKKICKFLRKVKSDFKDAVVYFSGILPKLGSVIFESINYINETVFNLCAVTNGMYFISHNSFAFNHKLNERFFWKDKIHTNRKGLRQLAFDFIDNIRYYRI